MKKCLKGIVTAASALMVAGLVFAPKTHAETKYLATINVTDYGVNGDDELDDYAAFESAIRAAAKLDNPDNNMVLVNVPAGIYYLSDGIPVFSNIHLKLDEKAIIKRTDLSQELIKNWHFGEDGYLCYTDFENDKHCNHGGYTQFQNIVIEGGIWDGNIADDRDESYSNLFMFYHGKNLTIKNLTIKNTTSAHMVMLDGVKDAVIESVDFTDCYMFTGDDESYNHGISKPESYADIANIASSKEAIHTDITNAAGSTAYPLDDTICENISVNKCNFNNVLTAVGSHHGNDIEGDLYCKNISVTDCVATNILGNFINNFRMKDTNVSGNTVTGAHYFIHTSNGTIKASNNTVSEIDSVALVQKGSEITCDSDKYAMKKKLEFRAYSMYSEDNSSVVLNNITMDSAVQGLIHVNDSTLCIDKAQLTQSDAGHGIIVDNSAAQIKGVNINVPSATQIGIKINNCVGKKVTVSECEISGMNKCIMVLNACDDVTISDNKLYNAKDHIIHVENAAAIITDNELYGVVTNRSAVRIDKSNYSKNQIKGNKIYQSKGNGIYLSASSGSIEENNINGCTDAAIRVENSEKINVLNNECINSGNRDIVLKGCNSCICKYNTITGAVKDDIYTDTDTNTISDNKAKNALQGWLQYGDYWYYYKDGVMQTGWLSLGKDHYFLKPDGKMVASDWRIVDGKWYYFNKDGVMQKNWVKISGKWYNFDGNGAMRKKEWIKSGKNYYYVNGSGIMVTSDWVSDGGKWYYFNADGIMQTGWVEISGEYYNFDGNGAMRKKEWIKSGKNYYYVNGSGIMVTSDWASDGGKWYYFNKDGVMQTGWVKISNKWYYFDKDGAMLKDWQTISGKYYYFNGDGVMQTGWFKQGRSSYYFNKDGVMQTGWVKISGNWYYFNESGCMLTGTQTIDGKKYTFDNNGVMK